MKTPASKKKSKRPNRLNDLPAKPRQAAVVKGGLSSVKLRM